MKKVFCLIAILLFWADVFAQSEPASYKDAVSKFIAFYNADKPDSIFSKFSPSMRTAVPLAQFKTTTTQLRTQLGDLVSTEFIRYKEPLGVYKANFKNGAFYLNIVLDKQNQFLGLVLKLQDVTSKVAIDASLTETPLTMKTLSGSISGSLVMPKTVTGKIPVVLIIAGSGPTDRNGNTPAMGNLPATQANDYILIANALGEDGIASLRYDKRMVGESVSSTKESELRIDDFVDDAVGLVNVLNDDKRFSKVIILGHSEGSLIGMLAAEDEPVSAFISVAGAGRPAEKILTEQMKSQPQYIADGFKTILDSLRKGKTVANVDPALYFIARPSIQPYLMSWCKYDPTKEIKKLKIPILIVQGTTDLQVTVDDAQKLKKARSEAVLDIIDGMNHILKDAPADRKLNTETYSNPDLPLKPEFVTALDGFVNKVK